MFHAAMPALPPLNLLFFSLQTLIGRVRAHLPDGDFEPLCRMLRKFLGFMNFTVSYLTLPPSLR